MWKQLGNLRSTEGFGGCPVPRASSLAAPVTTKVSQAPAADRSSSTCLWFLKDKPKPNNMKNASKRLWLLLLQAAASPHEAELRQGLGLQPAQFRGTWCVWAQ